MVENTLQKMRLKVELVSLAKYNSDFPMSMKRLATAFPGDVIKLMQLIVS